MHTSRMLALSGALAIGVVAGGYGVASAASGPGPGAGCITGPTAAQASLPTAQQPWCGQRSDETVLTGKTRSQVELSGKTERRVEAAATARFPGATIVRTETDADGNAAYEVQIVRADGRPATVYVDEQFDVVSVQTGMPAPTQRP